MTDLLVPGWGCKLSASAPALDNYPLECLIERRGPGFIAERFVKPPVDIVVEFPCPVSLTRILLHPSVGSHASSLLALAASASPASAAGPSLGPRTNDSLLWHELGTWRLWPYSPPQTHTDALFCIDNPAALPRASSATSSDSTPSDRIAETRTIAMGAARGLANLSLVRRLRLRILRTHEASPVALSVLRVLGSVADSTYSSRLNSVLRKTEGSNTTSEPSDEVVIVATLPAPKSFGRLSFAASSPSAPKSLPVPPAAPPTDRKRRGGGGVESINTDPDQLDPITGELMTDPVVLPSGHTVDRGTITRHLELHPTNPFTGLPLRLEQIIPDLRRRLAMDSERRTKARHVGAAANPATLTHSPRGDA